jgi:hypothetical protein
MKKIMRNKIELSDASSSRLVEDLDFFLPIEEVSLYIFIYLNEGCGSGGHDAEKLVLAENSTRKSTGFFTKKGVQNTVHARATTERLPGRSSPCWVTIDK